MCTVSADLCKRRMHVNKQTPGIQLQQRHGHVRVSRRTHGRQRAVYGFRGRQSPDGRIGRRHERWAHRLMLLYLHVSASAECKTDTQCAKDRMCINSRCMCTQRFVDRNGMCVSIDGELLVALT
jgi:hypothetical protein